MFIGVNLEFILEHTIDVLDYAFIRKAFQKKWQVKYNLKQVLCDAYKNAVTSAIIQPYSQVQTVTRFNLYYFPEVIFEWSLS